MTAHDPFPMFVGTADPGTCARRRRTVWWTWKCRSRPTHHIIWDDAGRQSVVCAHHADAAADEHVYVAMHPIGAACAIPGSTYVLDEARCVR